MELWLFYEEQTIVNNNFPNKLIDPQIKLYLYNIHKNSNNNDNNNTNRINLYYNNQTLKNYKLDKQVITNIIYIRHVKSTETQEQIKSILH